MGSDPPLGGDPAPALPVAEIRDYQRINAELTRLLDAGATRVRLVGAEGQRLLVAGLSGPWRAVVEVEGQAGPELAADVDAPGLTVVCHGSAADGAARGLRAGRVVVRGAAGDAVGYTQRGGTVVVAGPAGHRAGLDLAGGTLALLGAVGRLAGERQSGGLIFAVADRLGPHAGHARRAGRFVALDSAGRLDPTDEQAFRAVLREFAPWLPPIDPGLT